MYRLRLSTVGQKPQQMKNRIKNIEGSASLKLEEDSFVVGKDTKKHLGSDSSAKGCFFYSLNTQLVELLGYKTSAFLLKLKSEYKNGTIYNFSNRKISKIIGCSPTLAKKNIDILMDNGIVEIHNGNLSIRRISKIERFKNLKQSCIKILLSSTTSFKEYKDKCALLMIQRKSNQQRFKATRITEDSNKPKDKSEILPQKLAIGTRKMAQYLGVSAMTVSRLTKRLKKYGLNVFPVKTIVGKIEGEVYKDAFDRYAFKNNKGQLVIHYGSVYSFSSSLDLACSL